MFPDLHSYGQLAEQRVCHQLAKLGEPWQYFSTVEWRTLQRDGESIGEADVVVFHPQHGLVVIEIKAGAVHVQDGTWHYASGLAMKQSPFSQARRNRYALIEKLRTRINKVTLDSLTITHAAWFPDVIWNASLPGTEAPSRAFLLDRNSLADPEKALTQLFLAANPNPVAWSKSQQLVLKELLAPDCHLLMPLAVEVDASVQSLHQATEQQINVLRLLRSQSRLLVEGGAGSGKTLLAATLAREHAAQGKSVLLTCFNRQLALHLAASLATIPQITVLNFHELVKQCMEEAGMAHIVPAAPVERMEFFKEGAAEQLLNASEAIGPKFDSIIVDEAADFSATWWVALESLGKPGFSWYCFYDKQQAIYQAEVTWAPPFESIPMSLDVNLRNPQPIGELAVRLSGFAMPSCFQVEQGLPPQIQLSTNFAHMAEQLRETLRQLIKKEAIKPEQITVLAPYKHLNPKSNWSDGLRDVEITSNLATPEAGRVRVGTIQGCKGLESDVVILAGIDNQATRHPEWLYVGMTRAKGYLQVLALESTGLATLI